MWDPYRFNDPYEAVSVAELFSKLSTDALRTIEGLSEITEKSVKVMAIPKTVRGMPLSAKRLFRISRAVGVKSFRFGSVYKEIEWLFNEIVYDAGVSKP